MEVEQSTRSRSHAQMAPTPEEEEDGGADSSGPSFYSASTAL